MATITRAQLSAYLDDSLCDSETAQVEQALRDSDALRKSLRALIQEEDRGEHSIGAIWRRQRLSCPSREQLGSYLLQALEADFQDYVDFHIQTIGCAFCQANLADLKVLQGEPKPKTDKRRQRFFESSAGLLSARRDTK
jgi:hypothetical protein